MAGSGEFLARRLAGRVLGPGGTIIGLQEAWGPVASIAGCAHALVVLAGELSGGRSVVNERVVVKVGGSLLTWPGLRDGLSAYWQSRGARQPVVVVGGGGAADLVRDLDRIHGLGEDRSHHLALRALDLTARLLASLMPGHEVVECPDELASVWDAGRIPILSPRRFLEADADRPDPLPHTWEATTDSIAARVADRLGAAELALLKSAPLPPGTDLASAARLGLVDPLFPDVARGLGCVTYRNLRDPSGVATRLPP